MSDKPTRAEVLADYLRLSVSKNPLFCRTCDGCHGEGSFDVFQLVIGQTRQWCSKCGGCGVLLNALPDPLAPGAAADVWGPPIDRFFMAHRPGCLITYDRGVCGVSMPLIGEFVWDESPTTARVRAMMAADPALREKMEGAEG